MATLTAIFNGFRKAGKYLRYLKNSNQYLKDPTMLAKMVVKQFAGFFKTYIIFGIVFLLIGFLVVGAFVEGIGSLFKGTFAKASGMPVVIDKIPLYESVENGSYPISINYQGYNLDLKSEAYKYRLGWQLIATLDALNDTAQDISNTTIINKAKNTLKPQYTWGYDKYSKDTITDTKTYQEVSVRKRRVTVLPDGTKVYKNISSSIFDEGSKVTTKTISIPLPYLDEVVTPFKTYTYRYELDRLTKEDKDWSTPEKGKTKTKNNILEHVVTGEVGNQGQIYIEEIIETTNYKQTKVKVTEDVLIGIDEVDDTTIFDNFLAENDYSRSDIPLIVGLVEQDESAIDISQPIIEAYDLDNPSHSFSSAQGGGNLPEGYTPSAGQYTWGLPGYSRISSPFGYRIHPISGKRKFHNGLDIPAPKETPVVAASDGVVIYKGWLGKAGNAIMIDHGENVSSRYFHLNSYRVNLKQKVKKGDIIGGVGTTGGSTGNHLHFEFRIKNKPYSPYSFCKP